MSKLVSNSKGQDRSIGLILSIVLLLVILGFSLFFILRSTNSFEDLRKCEDRGGYYEVNCNPKYSIELGGFGATFNDIEKKCCISNGMEIEEFEKVRDKSNKDLKAELNERRDAAEAEREQQEQQQEQEETTGDITFRKYTSYRDNEQMCLISYTREFDETLKYAVGISDFVPCNENPSYYTQKYSGDEIVDLNNKDKCVLVQLSDKDGNILKQGTYKVSALFCDQFIVQHPVLSKPCSDRCEDFTGSKSELCHNWDIRNDGYELYSCLGEIDCYNSDSNTCNTCPTSTQGCSIYGTPESCNANQCATNPTQKCYWSTKEGECTHVYNCEDYKDKTQCESNFAKLNLNPSRICKWSDGFMWWGKGCKEVDK